MYVFISAGVLSLYPCIMATFVMYAPSPCMLGLVAQHQNAVSHVIYFGPRC